MSEPVKRHVDQDLLAQAVSLLFLIGQAAESNHIRGDGGEEAFLLAAAGALGNRLLGEFDLPRPGVGYALINDATGDPIGRA